MFHIYFLGSSEGLLFDVAAEPFPRALWNPLADRLSADGVRLRTGARAGAVLPGSRRRFAVPVRGGLEGPDVEDADAVVLATDVAGLRELVAASPELGDPGWRRRVAGLRTAPPFLVSRLWLDRPVHADRPAFLGTSGFPTLDNVTVLDRYEGEARRWARGCGGSVVELHGYALREGADPVAEHRRLVGQLHEVYPETAGARIVDQRYEWAADCPLFAPGGHAERPTVTTPDPHVTLAGDLVRVDLPVALMERAATTGLLAANALLARWRLAGHPVWSVPVRGRFTVARALARALRAPRPR